MTSLDIVLLCFYLSLLCFYLVIMPAGLIFPRRRKNVISLSKPSPDEVAYSLFLEHLTPKQKEYIKSYGHFYVKGSKGGIYKIEIAYRSLNMNIYSKDYVYCIHLDHPGTHNPHPYGYPYWDHILAQKLLIESDEDKMNEIALKGFSLSNPFSWGYDPWRDL